MADADQTYYCWALSTVSCLPFTNASYATHPSTMPVGILSNLHRLYCSNKSNTYVLNMSTFEPDFCMYKRTLQASRRTLMVSHSKVLQHFAEGIGYCKAPAHPSKTAGTLQNCCSCRWRMLIWRPFTAYAMLAEAGSSALALPMGEIKLLACLNTDITHMKLEPSFPCGLRHFQVIIWTTT